MLLFLFAVTLMAAAAATFVLCGGCRIGNSGNAIPSPFPFWSDLIIETRKRGFPGE